MSAIYQILPCKHQVDSGSREWHSVKSVDDHTHHTDHFFQHVETLTESVMLIVGAIDHIIIFSVFVSV